MVVSARQDELYHLSLPLPYITYKTTKIPAAKKVHYDYVIGRTMGDGLRG